MSKPLLYAYGGPVRAIGQNGDLLEVEGYAVSFGNPARRDFYKQFFTPKTDYGSALETGQVDGFVHHTHVLRGPNTTPRELEVLKKYAGKKLSHPFKLASDDMGIIARTWLDMRDEYEEVVAAMVQAEKAAFSSGALQHTFVADPSGEIKRWTLGENSFTPTPAEWRSTNISVPVARSFRSFAEAYGYDVEMERTDAGVLVPVGTGERMEGGSVQENITKGIAGTEEMARFANVLASADGAAAAYRRIEDAVTSSEEPEVTATTIKSALFGNIEGGMTMEGLWLLCRTLLYRTGDVLCPWEENAPNPPTAVERAELIRAMTQEFLRIYMLYVSAGIAIQEISAREIRSFCDTLEATDAIRAGAMLNKVNRADMMALRTLCRTAEDLTGQASEAAESALELCQGILDRAGVVEDAGGDTPDEATASVREAPITLTVEEVSPGVLDAIRSLEQKIVDHIAQYEADTRAGIRSGVRATEQSDDGKAGGDATSDTTENETAPDEPGTAQRSEPVKPLSDAAFFELLRGTPLNIRIAEPGPHEVNGGT